MNQQNAWELFTDTGEPVAYLFYKAMNKMTTTHGGGETWGPILQGLSYGKQPLEKAIKR